MNEANNRVLRSIGSSCVQLLFIVLPKLILSLLMFPFAFVFYRGRNLLRNSPVLFWTLISLVTVTALIVWAFLAIPDFGVWVLFILAGLALAWFLTEADFIFIWWLD
jgi:hypothetical protein